MTPAEKMNQNLYSSPTASFSSNGSSVSQQDTHSYHPDTYHSPDYTYTSNVSNTGFTDNADDLEYRLRELESAMMGTDQDFMESYDISSSWGGVNQATSDVITEMISRRDFKKLLIACAKAIAENDSITANWLMSELRPMVSVSGDPDHRLGAYMLEGLVAKLSSSGSSIYKSLRFKEPSGN